MCTLLLCAVRAASRGVPRAEVKYKQQFQFQNNIQTPLFSGEIGDGQEPSVHFVLGIPPYGKI